MTLPLYFLDRWPQIRAIKAGGIWQPAGGLFAVEGTVYPGAPFDPIPLSDNHYENEIWSGFASQTVAGVINKADGLLHCECVGYPAQTANMGASVLVGVGNLAVRVKVWDDAFVNEFGFHSPLFLTGWSQGAWVIDRFMQIHVFPEDGDLHYLLPYIYSIYNYGDILRTSSISRGNDYAGLVVPAKVDSAIPGGIGGPEQLTLEQTNLIAPDGRYVIKSFNNTGDLYGDAPMGAAPVTKSSMPAAGKVEYSFFQMIEKTSAFTIITGLMGDIVHIIGDVEAGYNAAKFFSAAQNAPHYQYYPHMDWAVSDIVDTASKLPHNLGV